MTEADLTAIIAWCGAYDALPFFWSQEAGIQIVLMPNEVYRWRDDATHEPRKPKPSPVPS